MSGRATASFTGVTSAASERKLRGQHRHFEDERVLTS